MAGTREDEDHRGDSTSGVKELISDILEARPDVARKWDDSRLRRDLGEALVRLRKRAGLTQKQLAQALGMDQAQVSRMESATGSWPSPRSMQRYAAACSVDFGFVFADHEHPEDFTEVVVAGAMKSIDEAVGED